MTLPRSSATATGTRPPGAPVVVVDVGLTTERDADHLALRLARAAIAHGGTHVVASTHMVGAGEQRRVVVAVEARGVTGLARVLADDAAAAAQTPAAVFADDGFVGPDHGRSDLEPVPDLQRGRRAGRAVAFPGSESLVGTGTVAQGLAATAIDAVRVLGGGRADPATALVTRDFVRPRAEDGLLVLHVQPAVGGTLVPFETPDPTPCCADHA